MKKLIYLSMFLLTLGLVSCEKTQEPMAPQEVDVTLDYSFMKSGSMSRAAEDLYNTFYENQIKTKKICPKRFTLTLFSKSSSTNVLEVSGYWATNNVIRLLEDTYKVQGDCTPFTTYSYACDSVYVNFTGETTISKSQPNVTLQAGYNCYLILIPEDGVKSVTAQGYSSYSGYCPCTVGHVDGVYYLFVNLNGDVKLTIKTNAGTTNNIALKYLNFEKGKYYMFNSATGTFDLSKMESGN